MFELALVRDIVYILFKKDLNISKSLDLGGWEGGQGEELQASHLLAQGETKLLSYQLPALQGLES